MKQIFILMLLILGLPLALAYSIDYNISYSVEQPVSFSGLSNYNYTSFNLTANTTETYSVYVPYSVSKNVTCTGVLQGNTSNNIALRFNNSQKTYNLSFVSIDNYVIQFNFTSDFEYPETLVLNITNHSYTFTVFKTNTLIIPSNINYETLNMSPILQNSTLVNLNYTVSSDNQTRNFSFEYKLNDTILLSLQNTQKEYRYSDLIVDVVSVKHKAPLYNISIDADPSLAVTYSYGEDTIKMYIVPSALGTYILTYNVVDIFNNTANIQSTITILPNGIYALKDVNVPSIKSGTKIKSNILQANSSIAFNIKVIDFKFEPENMFNYTSNNTLAYNVYLSDDTDKAYYLKENAEYSFTSSDLYFNIQGIEKGTLYILLEFNSTPDIQISKYMAIHARISNTTVMDDQSFNVAGRTVNCKLLPYDDINLAERSCSASFPVSIEKNLDLLVLSTEDYQQYEDNHRYQINYLTQTKDTIIKDKEMMVKIGWSMFIITLLVLIYVKIPKYWLKNTVRKQNGP